MPFYRVSCAKCHRSELRLMRADAIDAFSASCECGAPLALGLGIPQPRSLETVDAYRDKKITSDVEKMLDDRAQQHFKEVDLPKIIADQGIGYAQSMGFVDADGKAI